MHGQGADKVDVIVRPNADATRSSRSPPRVGPIGRERRLVVGHRLQRALLFGTKRCPPCAHLERLTGFRLVKALAARGGVNAAVFAGGTVTEGDVVRLVADEEAAERGAPVGADRPVPRIVGLPD